jgi:hypothetical protein
VLACVFACERCSVGHVPVWDMVEAHDASRDMIEGVIGDALQEGCFSVKRHGDP